MTDLAHEIRYAPRRVNATPCVFVGAAWVAHAVVTPLAVLHTPAALRPQRMLREALRQAWSDKCRRLRAQPGESLDASPYAAGATVSLFSATAPRNTRITSRTLRTPTNVCSSRTGR